MLPAERLETPRLVVEAFETNPLTATKLVEKRFVLVELVVTPDEVTRFVNAEFEAKRFVEVAFVVVEFPVTRLVAVTTAFSVSTARTGVDEASVNLKVEVPLDWAVNDSEGTEPVTPKVVAPFGPTLVVSSFDESYCIRNWGPEVEVTV